MSRTAESPCVSFKYFINLGNDRYGSMSISEKSNLYEQAERFCQQHNLQPHIAVLLENEMFQQILKIKQQMSVRQTSNQKPVGKILKNTIDQDKPHSQNCQTNLTGRTRNSGSILHQHDSLSKSRKAKPKTELNPQHFQRMFKRHEEIENKKKLSREASFQKITFRPSINNLSRKIVDLKRSSTRSRQNSTSKVFSIKIDTSSQRKKEKENACTGRVGNTRSRPTKS